MSHVASMIEAALAGGMFHEVIAPDGTHGRVATKDLDGMPSGYRVTGRLCLYAPDGSRRCAKKRELPKLIEAGYSFCPAQPSRVDLLEENRELRRRLGDLEKIFREAKRPVKSDTQLATALDVAGLLYETIAGRHPVGELLRDLIYAKVDHFGFAGFGSLLSELAAYLVPCVLEFLEVSQSEPLHFELSRLPARIAEKAEARLKFADALRSRIWALAAQVGITDADEIGMYETAVAVDAMRHCQDALRAAQSGDWAAVDQLFRSHVERSHAKQAN